MQYYLSRVINSYKNRGTLEDSDSGYTGYTLKNDVSAILGTPAIRCAILHKCAILTHFSAVNAQTARGHKRSV